MSEDTDIIELDLSDLFDIECISYDTSTVVKCNFCGRPAENCAQYDLLPLDQAVNDYIKNNCS